MRLALVQFNPTVGDLRGNAERAAVFIEEALGAGADLVVFPELALCGYPPRDLLLQEGFCGSAREEAARLAAGTARGAVLIGAPWREGDGNGAIFNSVLLLRGGVIEARYDKRLLPSYDVFDEERYFRAGDRPMVVDVAGTPVGVSLCEDLWKGADIGAADRYEGRADPVRDLVGAGARLIVNPSASPFVSGKGARQREILTRHVKEHGVAVAAVNQVGGNDDLIFDGHACVFVPDGRGGARLVAAGPGFEEALVTIDLAPGGAARGASESPPAVPDPLLGAEREALLWRALVLGVRDYCRKTGFTRCVLGLSGGIDSALTACIACAALGGERVIGVGLPGRYSSRGSIDDARALAGALGIRWLPLPIEGPHRAVEEALGPVFAALAPGAAPGVTEENIQSRLRGLLLMAVSNKTGAILLTTGNKSELAVGYCTLYGDMNGGLAVLSDLTKQDVYRLSRWVNAHHGEAGFPAPPVPEASITKPPSAELRPDQTDQDTLPPYEVLDRIVAMHVEERRAVGTIARLTGEDEALVRRIVRMIDTSEYKRRQMATGLKVTSTTFGPGRRWPIAQRRPL